MATSQQLTIYDKILQHFVKEAKGCIMAVTHDVLFLKALKGAYKSLGLDYNSVFHKNDLEKALSDAKLILKRYSQIIFFVEANIDGYSNILTLRNIKTLFGHKCKVIVITVETERNRIIQMYEMGGDNVIVKPVSINALIQKIALTLNPNNNLAKMVDEARSLIQEEKFDEAEKVTDSILKEKPDSAIALILKGEIAQSREQYETAEEMYIKASSQSKMYLEPLKKLSQLYEQINNMEKKLEYLKKLDRLSPLNHDRKIDIGQTYLQMDEEELARESFDEAVKQIEKQARDMVSSTLMRIAKSVGESRQDLKSHYIAKAISNKGSSLTREDLWMFNEIGISLRQQGKWEEAIEYYSEGLRISPMDGGLYYNMGMAYAQGKQYYKALENFQKAISNTPDIVYQTGSIGYNIARVYLTLNKHDDAARYLKKSLEADPDYEKSQALLKKIYK
ncbi:tetratricopeptide repeat protein [Desulfonatronovibrio magnus]|uniref:tetratricopeptide repeat protein n=1 Tax=Desulfonatronovibrio magnus TaxID=698827 RepID=UPI0005EAD82D|nr:tetratricopeptide repeat protein [Desulfonatronovibrio magnus]RQD60676.1 MAG: tetratricopeptide repeat protein [Desulfonatronovibrio sp. MSAO_Bac4]